jgi:hypothetical protein
MALLADLPQLGIAIAALAGLTQWLSKNFSQQTSS